MDPDLLTLFCKLDHFINVNNIVSVLLKWLEAVYLVMCNPSMNKLWVT